MRKKHNSRRKLYAEFLKTDFWKKLSEQQKLLYPQCSKCESTANLQSHHRQYPANWLDTTLADLETLCRKCHRKEHGLYVTPMWIEVERRIMARIMHEQMPAKEDWLFIKNDPESELGCEDFSSLMMMYSLIVLNKPRSFCVSIKNSILGRDERWKHLASRTSRATTLAEKTGEMPNDPNQ